MKKISLLIFLFFGLTKLIPPPDVGMNLNFGTLESGSGDIQPLTNENPTPTPPEPTAAATPVPEVEENVMTQTETETVEIKPTPEEIEKALG